MKGKYNNIHYNMPLCDYSLDVIFLNCKYG